MTAGALHHGRALGWVGPLVLLGMGTAGSAPAHAWNDFGHMTVAAVAWQHLNPAARAQATQLLRLNPDYPRSVSYTHLTLPTIYSV